MTGIRSSDGIAKLRDEPHSRFSAEGDPQWDGLKSDTSTGALAARIIRDGPYRRVSGKLDK